MSEPVCLSFLVIGVKDFRLLFSIQKRESAALKKLIAGYEEKSLNLNLVPFTLPLVTVFLALGQLMMYYN
jgi:hypothetical protein